MLRALVFGAVFHVLCVLSVLWVYFRSPVLHGLPLFRARGPAPASRLVLFVADGLRADRFFEAAALPADAAGAAPFLRSVVEREGSFGVSHTRVPTESRPGHVALIAGLYEDVSAVTKGWQANPVEFDSVLNRSAAGFAIGSPEITQLFRAPHVTELAYAAEEEDFASADPRQLDAWSFAALEQLLLQQPPNDKLDVEGLVVFVHLLGLDTNGHAHRPHSRDYLDNIASVDRGVARAVEQVEARFGGDGRTAYVFTADHGMSALGSHGDGDPANTRTPLVAWGAGVRGPEPAAGRAVEQRDVLDQWCAECEESAAAHWGLGHLRRKDVMQADVAPLMASLLGLAMPRNSVGVLPLEYLAPGAPRAAALLANAEQVLSQAVRKSAQLRASTLVFWPTPLVASAEAHVAAAVNDNSETEAEAMLALEDALQALAYLQRYDRPFLTALVLLAYAGWIAALAVIAHGAAQPRAPSAGALAAVGAVWLLLAARGAPALFYALAAFGVCAAAFARRHWPWGRADVAAAWPRLAAALAALELVVAAYLRREALAAVFAGLAALSPPRLRLPWLALAAFPLLPVAEVTVPWLVAASGALAAALAARGGASRAQVGLLLLASAQLLESERRLAAKAGMPPWLLCANWAAALGAPLLADRRPASLFAALATPYLLLSVSYEGVFLVALGAALAQWVSHAGKPDRLSAALMFLLLCQMAFFGTGNVASMSSFQIASTYRFCTVFSPFLMGALLIVKVLLPFALVAVAVRLLLRRAGMRAEAVFMLSVALSDVLAMQFFLLVRDEGSWKQIGNSISHFGIANAYLIFMPLLLGGARWAVPDGGRRAV